MQVCRDLQMIVLGKTVVKRIDCFRKRACKGWGEYGAFRHPRVAPIRVRANASFSLA
jgi:hypothetical protein